ncbi:MAG: hypothetical protein J0M12_05870, partial [Deltaproteobacteria bacterium]|nr:hypothetical protein [Deltaproteobacteria bacterium]
MMPLIMLAVFGGIIAWSFHYEKLRRKRFAELCQTHGFTNHEQPSENLFRILSQHGSSESAFPFFSRGRTQRILLLAEKKTVDRTNAIGLLRYRSGGKNKNTRYLSFCIFIRPGAALPHFQLCPESVLHKLIQNFGYQDID